MCHNYQGPLIGLGAIIKAHASHVQTHQQNQYPYKNQ